MCTCRLYGRFAEPIFRRGVQRALTGTQHLYVFGTAGEGYAVTDGQLTLRLKDLGGTDVNALINALVIQQLTPVANAGTPTSTASDCRSPFGRHG